MKTPNSVSAVGAWVLENGHRALLAVSGGRFPKSLLGMKTIELHAVGRKSGERRSTLLTTPIHDSERVVVIGSKGGYDHHPAWYLNLVANPDVEITIDDETHAYRARTATGTERSELWDQAVAVYKGYAGYQASTEREIPVVVCERS